MKQRTVTSVVIPCAIVTVLARCAAPQPGALPTPGGTEQRAPATAMNTAMNTLTPAERAAGWRLLFDGTTTAGWRGYKSAEVPGGWTAVDGALTKDAPTGDLLTADEFGDFELTFDWKVEPGGNAGVFYRGTEEYDHIYWSAPEYQLLDDERHRDGRSPLTSTGAAYGLYPAARGVTRPAGEWNSSRILARGPHVEHWLNGQKLLEYELWSPDWEAKVQGSKFRNWPNYARAKAGHIGVQGDHRGLLALRNIKIRVLP
jgi:hypothetical protein